MSEFTNQWEVADFIGNITSNRFLAVWENKKRTIALISPKQTETKEDLANALLISKAPEMLEMLKRTHELFIKRQFPTEKEMSELVKEIEQLIKEATEL